jgi:hypothetical protein
MRSLLLVALAVLGCAGCRDLRDGGEEVGLLRDAATFQKSVVLNVDELFPCESGTSWVMQVEAGGQSYKEVIRARPFQRNGRDYCALEHRSQGMGLRIEEYVRTQAGIYAQKIGGAAQLALDPAAPILKKNSILGEIDTWQGTFRFNGRESAGRLWYRATLVESISIPSGKFEALRVDTRIDAVINDNTLSIPFTRWFVPGMGVVKMRFRIGNQSFTKNLLRFQGGSSGLRAPVVDKNSGDSL